MIWSLQCSVTHPRQGSRRAQAEGLPGRAPPWGPRARCHGGQGADSERREGLGLLQVNVRGKQRQKDESSGGLWDAKATSAPQGSVSHRWAGVCKKREDGQEHTHFPRLAHAREYSRGHSAWMELRFSCGDSP